MTQRKNYELESDADTGAKMPMTCNKAKIVAMLVILGILLAPVPVVLANVMPTAQVWLLFDYRTSEQVRLEGVQIIGCDTPECNQGRLLEQYGRCESEGCWDPSLRKAAREMECLGDKCFADLSFDAIHEFVGLKIVGQFSDRVRESALLVDEVQPWVRTNVLRIVVQDLDLSVSPSASGSQDAYLPYLSHFFEFFVLTIVIELLVAALALRVWLRHAGRDLLKGLGYVFLANLISYPTTWMIWPALGQFQSMDTRATGCFMALVAVVFAALIANLSRKEGKARLGWLFVILALLSIVGMALFTGFVGAALRPVVGRRPRITAFGLPAGLTIALAEGFAVAFEGALLYLLARKTLALSLKQAALISLAMNVASFLVGILVVTVWQ